MGAVVEVIHLKISEIQNAKYNPRKISDHQFEGLKNSLKTWGFVDPVIVNKRNNTIVGGHMRVRAWESLGNDEVPCVLVDLSDAEEKALNIALNSPHISGEYDNEILKPLLQELRNEMPQVFTDLNFSDFVFFDVPVEKVPYQGNPDSGAGDPPLKPKTKKR